MSFDKHFWKIVRIYILKRVRDVADSSTGSESADRALSLSKCTCHAELVSASIEYVHEPYLMEYPEYFFPGNDD